MNQPSQAVPVRRVGDNTLRTLTVPVVFVPGVMGSRLELGEVRWDPDALFHMARHWLFASAETTRQQLSLDTDGRVMDTSDDAPKDRLSRGWGGLAWGFYGDFLQHLEAQRFGSVSTPVYAVGYDWRQDNRASGRYVAARIGAILQEHGAQHYFLVSHSMGGLVTRAMLKQDAGIAAKALGVVHIAQPALGAPVFYRRMFTGARKGLDGGFGIRNILGTSRESFQTILSAVPGPMQLMVTPAYRDMPAVKGHEPEPWLSITPFETAKREAKGVNWDTYLEVDSPPGLFAAAGSRHALPSARDRDLRDRVTDAKTFHDWLDGYVHPRTWSIYGNGLETDMAVDFDLPPVDSRELRMVPNFGRPGGGAAPPMYTAERRDGKRFVYTNPNPADRGLVPVRREEGDGTVPVPSAWALFPKQDHAVVEHTTDYEQKRQFQVTGAAAEHDKICHHPDAERCLFDIMRHVLGGPTQ